MMRALTMVLVLLVVSSNASSQPAEPSSGGDNDGSSLKITSGTMELGGTIDFRTDVTIPSEEDSLVGFVLNISPMAGYFVADGLELAAKVGFGFYFGEMYDSDEYDRNADSISFGVGARYFIDLERCIVPYVGAAFGMNFLLPKGEAADVKKSLAVEVPLGLMIALNEHIAIDLGIMATYIFSLEDEGGSTLSIPVGYMGVQAFF